MNQSRSTPTPRVIAFEGVDGAGKTTVVELIAEHLRARGQAVEMPRIGKDHVSKPIRAIRSLTRDRTNLDLSARAELLLYASREAQVIEQHVRPAIERGATILLDRSLLTPIVLGAYGRGLELETCEAVAAAASGGVQPDLTLIFDVEPRTSRIRKRLAKIRSGETRNAGRKGLAGSGFAERVRAGYLALAARDQLPILHAERKPPQDIAARVIAQLETGSFVEQAEDAIPSWMVDPALDFEQALESLPALVRLYFTRGLPMGRALRAELLEREPALAIWAADLDDPLFDRALTLAPALVLGRLSDLVGTPGTSCLLGERSKGLREAMAADHPAEVARSLRLVSSDAADRLRERLAGLAPGAVFESLLGRSDNFALGLRERLWKQADAYERAIGLRGCDDADAWNRRARLLDKDPAVLIPNLVGSSLERVDPILERFATRAPKSVLAALRGRTDATAHDLREQLLETGREVVDTIAGLDDPRSWALRERCFERWPSTVAASLTGLLDQPRAADLLARCQECAPADLFLKRRIARLTTAGTLGLAHDDD